MRAREVSVGIQDLGGELLVVARFKVRSRPLEREAACPEPSKCDPDKYGTRVKESARKRKEKELQKILESVEFPMGPADPMRNYWVVTNDSDHGNIIASSDSQADKILFEGMLQGEYPPDATLIEELVEEHQLQVVEEIGDDDIISIEDAPEQIPVIWEDA